MIFQIKTESFTKILIELLAPKEFQVDAFNSNLSLAFSYNHNLFDRLGLTFIVWTSQTRPLANTLKQKVLETIDMVSGKLYALCKTLTNNKIPQVMLFPNSSCYQERMTSSPQLLDLEKKAHSFFTYILRHQ